MTYENVAFLGPENEVITLRLKKQLDGDPLHPNFLQQFVHLYLTDGLEGQVTVNKIELNDNGVTVNVHYDYQGKKSDGSFGRFDRVIEIPLSRVEFLIPVQE